MPTWKQEKSSKEMLWDISIAVLQSTTLKMIMDFEPTFYKNSKHYELHQTVMYCRAEIKHYKVFLLL